jgi:hypothetical protein
MDGLTGACPKMDWGPTDQVSAWQSIKQHTEFWFEGPLAKKDEPQKFNYLMSWIGDKGRDMYSTWNVGDEDRNFKCCILDIHFSA